MKCPICRADFRSRGVYTVPPASPSQCVKRRKAISFGEISVIMFVGGQTGWYAEHIIATSSLTFDTGLTTTWCNR
jgi:hypothetical protein